MNNSKLLNACQKAISESGMTHKEIAEILGVQRERITELVGKTEPLRGTTLVEKVLSHFKPKEFDNLTK